MNNAMEYLMHKVEKKPGNVNYGMVLRTARGSVEASNLANRYARLIKNAKTNAERMRYASTFMKEYKKIQNKENAELRELEKLMTQRQRGSPKKKSPPRSSASVSGRPPRGPIRRSPAAIAMVNKLKTNLRAQITKLVQTRNHYQREINRIQKKLNAIQ
jgi:hypothetical protein